MYNTSGETKISPYHICHTRPMATFFSKVAKKLLVKKRSFIITYIVTYRYLE